jgi:hypothetical protein
MCERYDTLCGSSVEGEALVVPSEAARTSALADPAPALTFEVSAPDRTAGTRITARIRRKKPDCSVWAEGSRTSAINTFWIV